MNINTMAQLDELIGRIEILDFPFAITLKTYAPEGLQENPEGYTKGLHPLVRIVGTLDDEVTPYAISLGVPDYVILSAIFSLIGDIVARKAREHVFFENGLSLEKGDNVFKYIQQNNPAYQLKC